MSDLRDLEPCCPVCGIPYQQHDGLHSMCENLADLQRQLDDAREMLALCFGQMQISSCKMNNQHQWRFRNGWPMTHAIGANPKDAVRSAIAEVKRSIWEMENAT